MDLDKKTFSPTCSLLENHDDDYAINFVSRSKSGLLVLDICNKNTDNGKLNFHLVVQCEEIVKKIEGGVSFTMESISQKILYDCEWLGDSSIDNHSFNHSVILF